MDLWSICRWCGPAGERRLVIQKNHVAVVDLERASSSGVHIFTLDHLVARTRLARDYIHHDLLAEPSLQAC
jgi:hypothetical protein